MGETTDSHPSLDQTPITSIWSEKFPLDGTTLNFPEYIMKRFGINHQIPGQIAESLYGVWEHLFSKDDNKLRFKTLELVQGTKDRLIESSDSFQETIEGWKNSVLVYNTAWQKLLVEEHGFFHKVHNGSIKGISLGEGAFNTAFLTNISRERVVVRYQKFSDDFSTKRFATTSLEAYFVLRVLSGFKDIKVVEPICATRNVLVTKFCEGELLSDYFERLYGKSYYETEGFKTDPMYYVWQETREKINQDMNEANDSGKFKQLDIKIDLPYYLDTTIGNFIINSDKTLTFFDPLKNQST